MSPADSIRMIALGEVGQPYVLGEEGLGYVVGTEQSKDKRDTDCSGHVFSVLRKAGVKWKNGKPFERLTADGYWHLVEKIDKPSRVGDVGFILSSKGKAVHIILYVGAGETTEARGRKWGVVKYALTDPVNGAYTRGTKWGRLPWLTVGSLTPGSPATETVPEILERLFLKPHHSAITGQMITSLQSWYGIKPPWTLTVLGMETSIADTVEGGRLVAVNNFGAMRKPADMHTKWAQLASGTIKLVGKTFLTFPDPWTGMSAWGRLIKLGPASEPGAYLAALKAGDWDSFCRIYYGDAPGLDAYTARAKQMQARFVQRAAEAGVKW